MLRAAGQPSISTATWLVAAGLLLLNASPAVAQSAEASRYKGWKTASVKVQGLETDLANDLVKGLALSGQFKLYRRVRPRFYPRLLEEDIQRARLFLARRGYPDAEVAARFLPEPKKERVGIRLEIKTGPAVHIARLEIAGLPPDWAADAQTPAGLQRGRIFSEPALSRATGTLEAALRDDGYAFAKVQSAVTRCDSQQVAIHLAVTPGARYQIAGVAVTGTRPDLAPLARRTMSVRIGERYSPELVERAQSNLRMLNLFRQIRISTIDVGQDSLEMRAELIDRRPRSLEAGVGYWSDEFLRAQLRWEHRNLLRGGRGVGVTASHSRFLQSANASTWWPALLGARTRTTLRIGFERQWEKSYELLSRELELGATYRISPWSQLRASVAVARVDVDVTTPEEAAFIELGGLLTVLSLRWSRDRVNDRLYPTRGTVAWTSAEWAPAGILSESHFLRGEIFTAAYLRLASGLVAAVRCDLGLAEPIGGSVDLLPNRRFFAGGSRSMRGFKRRRLGPLDAAGAPLGGGAKLEASVELRFSLIWRFKGALFVDLGQVWRTIETIESRDLEYAAGPGLMLQTPVGPLRGDWARRLTIHQSGQPESLFHVSIGHPF